LAASPFVGKRHGAWGGDTLQNCVARALAAWNFHGTGEISGTLGRVLVLASRRLYTFCTTNVFLLRKGLFSNVGWVERSEPHHFLGKFWRWGSLRSTHPTFPQQKLMCKIVNFLTKFSDQRERV